jgi:hypothetical protein
MGDRRYEYDGLDRAKDRNFLKAADGGKIPSHRDGQLLNPIA